MGSKLRGLGRVGSRLVAWARRALTLLQRGVFPLVCLALVPLLGVAAIIALTRPQPDAKVVAAVVTGLFAAAFLASYGRDLALKVRKLGPVEFSDLKDDKPWSFSREYDAPDDFHGSAVSVGSRDRPAPRPLAAEAFRFQQTDRYLSFLQFSGGDDPPAGPRRKEILGFLLYVGGGALILQQWEKAIDRLEWYERLASPNPDPAALGDLAMATLYSALQTASGRKRSHLFADAARRLSRLAKDGELGYQGYFWLAYAQDELGSSYEAVGSNREALKRRPRYAPSKYNAAISLLKLDDPEGAFRMLEGIRPDDESGRTTLASAAQDPELPAQLARFRGTRWGRRIESWLERRKEEGAMEQPVGDGNEAPRTD